MTTYACALTSELTLYELWGPHLLGPTRSNGASDAGSGAIAEGNLSTVDHILAVD
jgi:hypothetical protein